MEHAPIEKSASATRPLLNQPMHLGIDDLHRKHRRQLRKRGHTIAAHFCPHAERRPFDTQSGAALRARLAINHKPVGTQTDQVIQPAGTE